MFALKSNTYTIVRFRETVISNVRMKSNTYTIVRFG